MKKSEFTVTMTVFSSRLFKEILAVTVISQGIFLTGFTYSMGNDFVVPTNENTLEEEGFSSFRDAFLNSVGCVVSAYSVEFVGRKKTIQLCFFSFICAGVLLLCNDSTVVTSVSRGVTAVSLGTKPVFIIYVLEVSQKSRRGMLISFYMTFASFGVTGGYIMKYYVTMRTLAVASTIIAMTGFCATIFLPETKYWYLMQNEVSKARESFSWFDSSQTSNDIDKEIDKIRQNTEEKRSHRYQHFLVATALLVFRAGSGNVVFTLYPNHYYSQFETEWLRMPMPIAQNLATFVFVIGFTAIIDCFERRRMLYFVTVTTTSTMFVVNVIDAYSLPGSALKTIMKPMLLLLYASVVGGFMEGLITIVSAEIVSVYARRGAVLNVSYLCSFTVQILYAVCFPYTMRYLTVNHVLLFFLFNNICMLALNTFFMPETDGKDVLEFGLFVTNI